MPELDSDTSCVWHLLLDSGMATDEQLTEVWEEHERTGVDFNTCLCNYGILTEQQLLRMLADYIGSTVVDVKEANPSQELVQSVPANVARMYEVFPVKDNDGVLQLAAANPLNFSIIDDLGYVLGREVQICVGRPDDVMEAIDHFYPEHGADSMKDVIADMEGFSPENFADEEDVQSLEEQASSTPIIRFVNIILYQAVKDQASDIHFEPFGNEFKIRYRIDGVLYEMTPPPKHLAVPVISRVKVISGLNIAERRLPQDGRIEMRIAGRKIDLRVSTLPTQYGESVVLRILDRSVVDLEITVLGLPANVEAVLRELIKKPNGIILVTGPTGCGKTTTLYSCLKEMNSIEDKLLTAEDPVEYTIEGIQQVPVREAIGMTFHRALKAFLRQDPDRIMVGEIRDLETAGMSVEAALTGHLVLSTLHTNDAPGAVTRLIDMGVEPFLITSTLEAVLAQRLVRRVCKHCKTSYVPTDEELEALEITREDVGSREFCYGKGCPECSNTGYRGRKGLFELFRLTHATRTMIADRVPASRIAEQARSEGMQNLREHGIESIFSGETSVEEVLKYT